MNIHRDSKLILELWDSNKILKDEKIGEREITISELSKSHPGIDFKKKEWFNLSKLSHTAIFLSISFEYSSLENMRKTKSKANITKSRSLKSATLKSLTPLSIPPSKLWKLRINLYLAQGLKASDSNGLADPICFVRCNGKMAEFSQKMKTINPDWFESKEVIVSLPVEHDLCPDVHFLFYDSDFDLFQNARSRQLLGRFKISIKEIEDKTVFDNSLLNPEWHHLKDADGKLVSGRALLTCQLFQADLDIPPANLRPHYKQMWVEISTLGLRGLKGTFLKKPHVEFRIGDVAPIKTRRSCVPSNVNPNILQVLKIPINIAEDPRFSPVLEAQAIDEFLRGSIRNLIGSGSLPLEPYVRRLFQDSLELSFSTRKQVRSIHVSGKSDVKSNMYLSSDPVNAGSSTSVGDPSFAVSTIESKEVEIEEKIGSNADSENENTEEKVDTEAVHIVKLGENILDQSKPSYMKGRDSFDNELEDIMPLKPFEEFLLKIGSSNHDFFEQGEQEVGKLKGMIRLLSSDEQSSANSGLMKDLLSPADVFVRLYVLTGTALVPKDDNGSSDPYLIASLGDQKISLRDRYISDTLEPEFYEVIEFPTKIPGASELKVEVWDWDGIGDDLIGATTIDIEDRWFTQAWRDLKKKPVENRTLHCPTSKTSQGKLRLWVDIFTAADAKKHKVINIKPPPPMEYELRVIVWETKEVVIKDEITEQNDLYLTGTVDDPAYPACNERQRTDTHLRSKKGIGSFNWRMIFKVPVPIPGPLPEPRFKMQIWDMDFFSANDSICEASIDLRPIFNQALKTKGHVKFVGPDEDEKIWVRDFRHANSPGVSSLGQVLLSFELLPLAKAIQFPAGKGRDEPNQNPTLPPPKGRLQFELTRPWEFIREILGDKIYGKCCLIFWCGMIIAALAFFLPSLASAIIADVIS